jgi:hypothetical protein
MEFLDLSTDRADEEFWSALGRQQKKQAKEIVDLVSDDGGSTTSGSDDDDDDDDEVVFLEKMDPILAPPSPLLHQEEQGPIEHVASASAAAAAQQMVAVANAIDYDGVNLERLQLKRRVSELEEEASKLNLRLKKVKEMEERKKASFAKGASTRAINKQKEEVAAMGMTVEVTESFLVNCGKPRRLGYIAKEKILKRCDATCAFCTVPSAEVLEEEKIYKVASLKTSCGHVFHRTCFVGFEKHAETPVLEAAAAGPAHPLLCPLCRTKIVHTKVYRCMQISNEKILQMDSDNEEDE